MKIKLTALALALALVTTPLAGGMYQRQMDVTFTRLLPHPPEQRMQFSAWRTAPIIVAEVFGRATWTACSDADPELVTQTAEAAIHAGLDPAIAAATVAIESSCNVLALSGKAVGLMQIKPDAHPEYDFSKVNLLNRVDNLRTGSEIMAGLVNQYGVAEGVHRYNGLGQGCPTCDAGYAAKILTLAHK